MLLVVGQAMTNVQGALVQLGSQSRSTFFHFHTDFPIDVVFLRRADHLDDEPYLPGLPFWVLIYPCVGHRLVTISPQKALGFRCRSIGGELATVGVLVVATSCRSAPCASWAVPLWHRPTNGLAVGLASWAWPREPL
jgi:hypothetical protein